MQTQGQQQPSRTNKRLLSSRKPEIWCCLHKNPQVHLTIALVYRHQAVCFPPFPTVMQLLQPLLKNLLPEPEAAFLCTSVHRGLGFISRFTGNRFWLHRLNFFNAVGWGLVSPEVIHPFWSWCSKGYIYVTEEQDWEARTWVYSHVLCYRFPVWFLALHSVLLKGTQFPPTMGNNQFLGASVCIVNMGVIMACPKKSGSIYLNTGHRIMELFR